QHSHCRPDRLFLAQAAQRRSRRIIHHVHQTTSRASPFQPVMETPIHLHQLPKVSLALTSASMRSPSPLSAPQPFRQHPLPQCLNPHHDILVLLQVLRRQGRPKTLARLSAVLLPYQSQDASLQTVRLGMVRRSSHVAMHQPLDPFRAVPFPQALRLPIARSAACTKVQPFPATCDNTAPRLNSRSSILVLFTLASSEAMSLGDTSIRDRRG